MFSVILFAAVLAGGAPEPAPQAPSQAATSAPAHPPSAKPKRVCKTETPLGARVPRKVCRTVEEAQMRPELDTITVPGNPFPANN